MKRRKSLISRITSALISGTVAVLSVPVNAHVHTHAHAEENDGELKSVRIVDGETSKYGEEEVKFIDENGNEIIPNLIPEREERAVTFPSSYDLRDYNYLTSVKQQYPTGSCWAHAALASAESNMIINGLADTSIDLSEAHLVWFARGMYSTDTSDPLYMDGENLGTDAYNAGGNYRRSQATLARWSGIQLEENAPSVTTSPELSESQRYTSYGYLVNSNNYDISDTDSIKTHLMNDGALTISYYSTDYVYNNSADCYSDTYDSYYQTAVTGDTNHAVTLVGWDDNFSKNKFEGAVPKGNGAWICKNSWGDDRLDGGYFYISYYEPTLANIASFEIASTDTYDSLYQYDGSVEAGLYYSTKGISGANIYTAEQTETIKSIGLYTDSASVPYIISIYKDVEAGKPMSGTLLTTQKGEVTYAGYHAIDLLESVTIEKGTTFSVVLTLDKAGASLYYDNCVNKTGISYITSGVASSTSSWTDYSSKESINFCIKAYTLNGIEINETNFPNTAFRNYVKSAWDSDGNGYLSDAEAAAAKTINVSGLGISDLTGIEYFTSATTLNCSSNPLLALDLSANTAMTKLVTTGCSVSLGEVPCYGFTLTGLDVSKMSSVSGATVKNNAIYPTSTTITYNYDCENGLKANLSLKLSGISHTLGSWAYSTTSAHIRECSYCTYSESGTHSFGAWRDNGDNHIHTCSVCSGSETADHTYDAWAENADGTHSRSCSVCGNVDNSDHSFGDWVNNGDGTHKHSCVDCDYSEAESHSFGSWSDNGTNHIRYCDTCDATETANHSYGDWTKLNESQHAKICTSCGDTVTADHDFTDWKDNADGTHSRSCSDCGYTETVEHDYSAWSDNKDGNHKRTCADCGNVETVKHVWGEWTDNETNHQRECEVCHATETADHVYGEWTELNESQHAKTCTSCGDVVTADHNFTDWKDNADGKHTRSCNDCGYSETVEHDYSAWSDNSDGNHKRTCADCGSVEIVKHVWGEWTDNGTNHQRECEVCHATETANHIYGDWTKLNESQHAKICTSCGDVVTASHNFSDWTDNADGTHSRSCSDCGYSETVEHDYSAWSDNKDGNHKRTCADCGNVETVKHVWGEWTDNNTNHQRECEVCHATETANHSYGDWTKLNESQHAKICTSCGDVVTADHNFTDWKDNVDGTHSRSCSDCEYTETVEHNYSAWSDNKDGNHKRTCADCGSAETVKHVWGEWTDNETNHQRECEVCYATETANHSYGDWTKLNESQHAKTCTSCGDAVTASHNFTDWKDNADGTHSRSCSDCEYTETVEHDYSAWSDNKDGNHKRTCTDCGSVETVKHVWGEWTDNETNHQRECEVCHAIETANHSYGDWAKSDENLHAKTCEDCGNAVSEEHHYGEWSDNGNAQQMRSCTDCGSKQIEDVAYTPGDLNRDGIINIFDVVLARCGFIDGFADSASEASMDVDCDGKILIADMVRLQSFVEGKIDSFVS